MSMKRRDFFKIAGAAGLTLAGAGALRSAQASPGGKTSNPDDPEFKGMLIDTTLCIGCRECERACMDANELPTPEQDISDPAVLEKWREPTPDAFKVINKIENQKSPENPIYVPKQCLHCNQPACASACLTKALEKTKEGPVVYHADRCMGCRYCMVACPFEIPKFDYTSPAPYIRKCIMCFEKLKAGQQPACATACPQGATKFGTRRELLREARQRVYANPDKYYPHIYGENEVGGTGVMYLSSVPFEQLGFKKDLGSKPYPELTKGFLSSVPLVFVLWPSVLAALNTVVKGDSNDHEEKDHE